jgi:hypothetical protein
MVQKLKLPMPQWSRIRAIERIQLAAAAESTAAYATAASRNPSIPPSRILSARRLLNILTGISISAETYPCLDDGLNKGFIGERNCRETGFKTNELGTTRKYSIQVAANR